MANNKFNTINLYNLLQKHTQKSNFNASLTTKLLRENRVQNNLSA